MKGKRTEEQLLTIRDLLDGVFLSKELREAPVRRGGSHVTTTAQKTNVKSNLTHLHQCYAILQFINRKSHFKSKKLLAPI